MASNDFEDNNGTQQGADGYVENRKKQLETERLDADQREARSRFEETRLEQLLGSAKKLEKLISGTPFEPMPEDFGLAYEIQRYALKALRNPVPLFATGCSLMAMSMLTGRYWIGETNARSNLFFLFLAPSGSGKDSIISILDKFMTAAGWDQQMFSNPRSDVAMVRRMAEYPHQLFIRDEMHKWMSGMLGDRNGFRADMPTVMMELFSSSARTYGGAQYADGDYDLNPIREPHLTVCGVGITEQWYSQLNSVSAIDGLLNRFLTLESDAMPPDDAPRKPMSDLVIPKSLVGAIEEMVQARGDIAMVEGDDSVKPEPTKERVMLELHEECADIVQAYLIRWRRRLRSKDPGREIWVRAGEYLEKLMICIMPGIPKDQRDDMANSVALWAGDFVEHVIAKQQYRILTMLGHSPLDTHMQAVKKWLGKQPRVITSKAFLDSRAMRKAGVHGRMIRDVLLDSQDLEPWKMPETNEKAYVNRLSVGFHTGCNDADE